MVHRPNVGIPHVSPHVVPKASLGGAAAAIAPIAPADEEKTAVDSSWEDEQSTIDQAEMADKVRRALAEKRRAGSAGSTTATTGGHSVDEPTVEDRARPGIEAAAALGVARLVVESGPDAGKDFPLRAGKPVLVGRALDNSVVLTDLSVSRKHFEINWDGGHWALTDRGSGNGTLLNGKLEEGTFRLFAGDRIEIGHTTFRFEQTGAGERNQWAEEEPSTIAGRRNPAVGSPRPSALQTSEFGVSPGESAAISMVERKPIPLTDPRNLPIDLHRRPTAAPSPNPYTSPPSASVSALSPAPTAAPGSPGLPPPSSPQFLGNSPRPPASRPLLGDIPGGTAGAATSGLGSPLLPASRSTALGNPPPGSSPHPAGASGPVSGQNGPPSAPLGTPMMNGLAPPRSSPMNTLPGRPPVVGPTAPPPIGDGMVPPRQVSQSNIPLDMIPAMTTVPHPRSLVAPPMSRPTLSAQHERAIAPRMMSRNNDMIADSGVAVSPPRFPVGPNSEPRSLLADGVPSLTRPNKTTIALIAGGVVLLVAVVALAMTVGGDSPATSPESNATTSTTAANGTSVEPIDQPVKSAELLAVEKAAAEKAAAEKAAAEKAAAEKLAAEKAVAEKTAAEQAAAEKLAAEKLTAERLAAEKLAAEKLATEQAATEKAAAEKAAAEKLAAEKTERLAAEKLAAEKAAAQKADKAAAAREARLAAEKAAAEKAAAQKAAKNKKEQPKRVEKEKERVETAAPQAELDSEAILGKAEDLYRKKNFPAAASTIREAIRGRTTGTDELRATAQIYEALQRTYSAGTAVGAKPTEAYTNLRSASRYDEKLGGAHSSDINPRILALAPRAAAQFLALKQYEEAFQALRDAERAGASNSTLNAVRTAVDARANELYNEAQSKRADDPAAARSLYKKVLKLVDSGTPLYQKASKGIAETT